MKTIEKGIEELKQRVYNELLERLSNNEGYEIAK